MEDFVTGKNARSSAAANGFSEDAVAVMVVQDQNVDLSSRWLNDGSETLMCFAIFGIAVGEKVGVERRPIRNTFGFGGSLVFATLIKVTLIIATDCGGCLVNALFVRPIKCGRYPRSNAVLSVDRAGEKSAACAKATSSAGVADWTAA